MMYDIKQKVARVFFIRRFFCCDLQLGTYFASVFCMALSALTIWSFIEEIETVKAGQTKNEDDLLIRNNFIEGVLKVLYTGMGFCAVDTMMGMFLICGTFQLKVCVLWTWIKWRFFMFKFFVGVTVFLFVAWVKIPPIGIILLINLILSLACFIVVFSLTQEIREMEDLKKEVTLDTPAVLLSNKKRLSSQDLYL